MQLVCSLYCRQTGMLCRVQVCKYGPVCPEHVLKCRACCQKLGPLQSRDGACGTPLPDMPLQSWHRCARCSPSCGAAAHAQAALALVAHPRPRSVALQGRQQL